MDMELVRAIIAAAALGISILAFLTSRKSKIVAEKALALAESKARRESIDFLSSIPSMEVVEILEVDGIKRAKLHVANLRSTPFKIHCLKVYQYAQKEWSIKNMLMSICDPNFNWEYEVIEDVVWNPKGSLDDSEKFINEAVEFLVVKEREYLLVSIPGFKYGQKYKYEIQTSHGNRTITGTAYERGKTYFSNDFEQSYN